MTPRRFFALFLATFIAVTAGGRERLLFDDGWLFAFGDASSPERDFGCGTEYFNYLTKVASIHNEGPYSPDFKPEKWGKEWEEVQLPHDWVVDLPFDAGASHSHGYKTVGYRYPLTSVGWYRKTFQIPASDRGRRIALRFDGIFRDSKVWVNGFYLGGEPSGYVPSDYDITEYLNYGGDNVVTVRADASLEEGWFYEGAGIYRHVWLEKTAPLFVVPDGVNAKACVSGDLSRGVLRVATEVGNHTVSPATISLRHTLYAPTGEIAGQSTTDAAIKGLMPRVAAEASDSIVVDSPVLWSVDEPRQYRLLTEVIADGRAVDSVVTRVGFRHIRFDADSGFYLNGKPLKIKGVNMHQDHAGVGVALPDALHAYRLHRLKELGVNAYRSSHNPMTPEMLDVADTIGILVLEESRLPGVNEVHLRPLEKMIRRDRNHPCVIGWSVANEEWGIEWDEKSERIASAMREFCHRLDPSRPMAVASSSGPNIVKEADIAGYNYILQNPVDRHRTDYPARIALGTEETSGCGTRGVYFDAYNQGRTSAINRHPHGPDSLMNAIERGWKFYAARPWLGGLFYWTGFDYRGEPNPLKYPATGSQFGILDYCGFPKDEAAYLKSWWTDEPTLHIFPHWNLEGHEGEPVDIWAYSNCDEVELWVNGKNLGRKQMPEGGHLSWSAVYKPGKVRAVGYRNGRRMMQTEVVTTGRPAAVRATADRTAIAADGRDVAVCRLEVVDAKGHVVPTACVPLTITVNGPVCILGAGNGDPAFRGVERPTDAQGRSFTIDSFNGLAQVLLQSSGQQGSVRAVISTPGCSPFTLDLEVISDAL